MWSPTHVQVTVQRAKDLLIKGKNGTNDAFVTIALGKEKFQTSVKEKSYPDVEWHEECELQIPKHGNTAEIILTVLHRNFLGVDEFLGIVHLALSSFDIYERPRNRWYALQSKPGKEKKKSRGELEVKVGFIVKSGSLMDLNKNEKHRTSLGQISHIAHSIGGSLLSISSLEKRKGLKKLTKSIGHKVAKIKGKAKDHGENHADTNNLKPSSQVAGEADPGVVTDGESEDDFTFDDLSHKSSGSSLNINHHSTTPVIASLENLAGGEFLRRSTVLVVDPVNTPAKPPSGKDKAVDEWEQKLYGKQMRDTSNISGDTLKRRSWESAKSFLSSQPEEEEPDEGLGGPESLSSSPVLPRLVEEKSARKEEKESKLTKKFKHFRKYKDNKSLLLKEIQPQDILTQFEEASESAHHSLPELAKKYATKSKEELIEIVCEQQLTIDHQRNRLRDLEDYLDNLLLRVMETTPRILQNPYIDYKTGRDSG